MQDNHEQPMDGTVSGVVVSESSGGDPNQNEVKRIEVRVVKSLLHATTDERASN
jgi:hypothetical protein